MYEYITGAAKKRHAEERICGGCAVLKPWEHRCCGPEHCDCRNCNRPKELDFIDNPRLRKMGLSK